MIKFHVIYNNTSTHTHIHSDASDVSEASEADKNIELNVSETARIGTLIKIICEKIKNQIPDIDILNSLLIYNGIELDHSKSLDNYSDFQYRKEEYYTIIFIPKYYQRVNKVSLTTTSNKSAPISVSLPQGNLYVNKQLNKIIDDKQELSLEQRLTNIEKNQIYVIEMLNKILSALKDI